MLGLDAGRRMRRAVDDELVVAHVVDVAVTNDGLVEHLVQHRLDLCSVDHVLAWSWPSRD